MKIRELMDSIRDLDMVLPEFQREYVWEREQAKQLIVSLYREYPTGSLLFWKTANPPEIKNTAIPKDKIGTTLVILDGQQRLTTLYLLTRGTFPPYYKPDDIKNDPRNLFFDLDTGDFQYYQPTRMQTNPTWVSVTECFTTPPRIFDIAKQKLQPGQDPFELAQRYNDNLTRLQNTQERDYPVQIVPPSAHIDDAIDVFDRVNSLGTKLTDAELALAHITGKWPKARQSLKDKIRDLAVHRFSFDLTFMVRALVAIVNGRALFETIHQTSEVDLKAGWSKLTTILDYLVSVLPSHAHIHSTDDLNTTNVLVPAVVYLARHNAKFENDLELRRFVHWLYAASTWARYSSQTDQKLDHDISIVQRSESPWKELVDALIEQRGRIEVKPSDLEGRVIQHPLYRMTFIMAKAHGAKDWFNGIALGTTVGPSYAIHNCYIFPPTLLYQSGYESNNHLHKQLVNEIANRAFLTTASSVTVGALPPEQYLAEIEKKYPGTLAKQFVPNDPSLWKLDRFEDFLAARRKLIAEALNQRMRTLITELEPTKALTLEEMILGGESPVLELKSSLRWDLQKQQVNTVLQKVIAKTVAGFLNFEGGILLIGVADDGTILGVEADMKTVSPSNLDRFEQVLRQTLVTQLGAEFSPFVNIGYEVRDGKTVCIVKAERCPQPVYLTDGDKVEFYIRAGNTTQPLDIQATQNYIGMHWES